MYGGFVHMQFLEDRDFLGLYDSADAMIHFSEEESFGLTFAEALARNLPLFASDVGAIRQIVDGVNICRVFDVSDFRGLVEALRIWIPLHSDSQPRVSNPNSIIASRYSPQVIAQQHINVYREIVSIQS
jgi:glycosyltransferase involved in cell wall biosynthesis